MAVFWGADIKKNEWTLKREGTFKRQINHIRPKMIVLFNPQGRVDVLSRCTRLIGCVNQVNLKVKHESSNQNFSVEFQSTELLQCPVDVCMCVFATY